MISNEQILESFVALVQAISSDRPIYLKQKSREALNNSIALLNDVRKERKEAAGG